MKNVTIVNTKSKLNKRLIFNIFPEMEIGAQYMVTHTKIYNDRKFK